MNKDINCASCWYSRRQERPIGLVADVREKMPLNCMRFPPHPLALPAPSENGQMGIAINSIFPIMSDASFCGEFKPKQDS